MSIKRLSGAGIATPKSSKAWDQTTFPGYMEAIATAVVDSSGASSIVFSNIPQTYKHLHIRAIHRVTDSSAAYTADVFMRVGNGSIDAGNNYSNHQLVGDGSSASAPTGGGGRSSVMAYDFYNSISNLGYANMFGVSLIDIMDYANTTKKKTIKIFQGREMNVTDGSGRVYLESGNWASTSAINTVGFYALTGTGTSTNFAQYSHVALYGIRG